MRIVDYRARRSSVKRLLRFPSHGSVFNINVLKDKKALFGTLNATLKPIKTKNMTLHGLFFVLRCKINRQRTNKPGMETDPCNHTKKGYPLKEKQNTLICV